VLKTGSTVPDLALQTSDGRRLKLSDLRGEPVLLYFMRAASCMMCNAHVKDLVARKREFDARGVRVFIALPEDTEKAARWKAKRQVPFEVVTGRAGTPHEAVGLHAKMFGAMQQSGTVIVDAGGTVRHAHSATVPNYDKQGIAETVGALAPARAA
jgi:peroxiredoxin